MVKVIMHGCNGKMGQVISGLIAVDPDMELVAGIDARDDGHNPYPVFTDIAKSHGFCAPPACPRHSWRK